MTDPSRMRVSDADRHKVAEVLREAAGEGRLDMAELDERLEATYAAKVYDDLLPIVADLPGAGSAVPEVVSPAHLARPPRPGAVPTSGATRFDTSVALMGSQTRKGLWEIGATHNAFTLMGGIDLDLREAHLAAPEVVITANAIMGGIDIVVNQWTRVSVEGVGIMGDYSQARDKVAPEIGPQSPLVRVKGLALMGGVTVRRKPMPGQGPGAQWFKQLGH